MSLSALLLYSEQGEHDDPMVYSRTISPMEMGCVQLNTVINYWFTLHRALGPLYQQAQTSSPNIRGISDQDVTELLIQKFC